MPPEQTPIVTTHVQSMLEEATAIVLFLDGLPVNEPVEWDGHTTTPAMLLAVAMNRCQRAAAELDATRLTYFGFPER